MPLARVSALLHDRRGTGFRALYDKAGLPASTYPAFREAVEAMREGGFVGEPGGATRLKRRMVERVLTRCADEALGEIEPLLLLLRRFAAEAAREEARMFCNELVADDAVEPLDRRLRYRRRALRGVAYCSSRVANGSSWPHVASTTVDAMARPDIEDQNDCSPGASGGARMSASTSGRSLFSCARNSSVTSRSARSARRRSAAMSGARLLADDGAHRIDMLVDQRERNAGHVRACARSAGTGCRRTRATKG